MSDFLTDSQQELFFSGFFFLLFGMCSLVAQLHLLHFLITDATAGNWGKKKKKKKQPPQQTLRRCVR